MRFGKDSFKTAFQEQRHWCSGCQRLRSACKKIWNPNYEQQSSWGYFTIVPNRESPRVSAVYFKKIQSSWTNHQRQLLICLRSLGELSSAVFQRKWISAPVGSTHEACVALKDGLSISFGTGIQLALTTPGRTTS